MKFGSRTILLALIGALSAVVAFLISAPYVNTLGHPGLPPTDPRFNFTVGSTWGTVNHWVSGSILCCGFAFVLAAGRKGPKYGLISGLLAAPLGGALGALADSTSDRIGIALYPRFGSFPAPVIWSLLVPAAYAITVTLCIGLTMERIKRAAYATVAAWIASAVTVLGVSFIIAALAQAGLLHLDLSPSLEDGGLSLMKASIPIWEATAISVGLVLGIVFSRAESIVRSGSVTLMVGRNEGREWNLDFVVNRIGSAEGVEIPVRGFQGVSPVHARIVHHAQGFVIEDLSGGNLQLNGQPVQQAWLNTNDMINMGQAVLVFSGRVNAWQSGYPSHIAGPQQAPSVAPYPAMQPAGQFAAPYNPQTASAPGSPRMVDVFGNNYLLQPGLNGIGREAGNTIALHWDISVSRRHAEIKVGASGAQIRDLGSSNGTRLNGRLVQDIAALTSGDAVQVGNVMLQFLM